MTVGLRNLATLTALTIPVGTSYGHTTIINLFPPNTTTRNVQYDLHEIGNIQRLFGTGNGLYEIKIENETATGGIRYRLATEATHSKPTLITESVSSMLAKVKSVFALSVSDLSKVIGVERPTIYAWTAERAVPHAFNLERLKELFNLAKQSEKWLVGLADKQIKQFQIQDTSLPELLSQDIIPKDLLLSGLESIKISIEQDLNNVEEKRLSLKDLAAKHGISIPSKESSRDTFDLVTGKRTDPELE
jgi:predicted DNA-binding transcriptional regulator AlpA